jgi:hypothetical protein
MRTKFCASLPIRYLNVRYITIFSFVVVSSYQDVKTAIATSKVELNNGEGPVSAKRALSNKSVYS